MADTDDRGLEGPADARYVEAPAGLTPLELRAGEEARRSMLEHLGRRMVLTMDQLAEMKDVRPRFEKEVRLPGDTRGASNRIYFFSIDGTIGVRRHNGCLFAGECIMVQSDRGFEHAFGLAKAGLNDTVEIAREYYDELNRSVAVASPLDVSRMDVAAGGRRAVGAGEKPALHTDRKLKAIIAEIIGGKPWRG